MLPFCSWLVVWPDQEWINRKKWCINIWNLWYEEQKLKQSPWIESLHFSIFDYTVQMSSTTRSLCCRGCKTLQNGTPPSAPQPNQCLTYPYYSLHSNALLIPKSMPYYSLCGKWNHFKGIPAAVLFKFFTWSPQKANANLVHLPVTVPGSVYGLLLLCCFLACVSWVKFMDSFTCHPQNVG